ncbi:MAG: Rieske (2Fe-2S) protein [Planctomycetaceae bacterium]|nr:MAG: Rieske (2Fe-2S) protein [Planctomycetaceae bacterium]
MERRTLLTLVVHGGSVLVGVVVGLPALIAGVFPALRRRRGESWRPVGQLSQFPVGQTQAAVIEHEQADESEPRPLARQGVYVWRPTDEEVVVFSRSCTDLGCPVIWDAGSQCFYCPCHGGIFARDGQRMAGPPDRELHRYVNRVREGVLEVDVYSVPPIA